MVKYRQYYQKMLEDNKELFDSFRILHDNYALNPEEHQGQFNKEGEKIMAVIREYENRLCRNTERGVYSKYSTQLAEKFQNEVRIHFPKVDSIGIIIEGPEKSPSGNPQFSIKKIYLP